MSTYSASSSGISLVAGDYDAGITEEIDRKIRHMPVVVAHINKRAYDLLAATDSENFEVILSAGRDQQRPRAYVAPANGRGIHEELSQAVLLKAAMGMAGK